MNFKRNGFILAVVAGLIIAGIAVGVFGAKAVLTWLLIGVGSTSCVVAALLATDMVKNERLRNYMDNGIIVAVIGTIVIGTLGLFGNTKMIVAALCLIQASVFILLFVAIVTAMSHLFRS